MSATVPPNLPPSPGPTLASVLSSARGTVVSVPESTVLTQGLSLNAQVVSSSNGQLVLSTSLGKLTVQSSAALPNGTSVLLQVLAAGEAPQVSLHFHQSPTTFHGALPGPAQNAAAPQGGGQAAAAQPGNPVITQLTEGSVLQATVTRAAGPAAATGGATPTVSPAAPGGAPAPGAPGLQAAPHPGASAPTAAATLTAGTSLTVRVLAVAPPGSALPAVPALPGTAGARVFAATVTGHQASGAPVVTGDAVDLALPNAQSLPTGSRLLLEVINLRAPLSGDARAPLSFLDGRWEALNQALSALQQIDPALLRHAIETTIPTPGTRLAGTTLFFLSAMFSGDVRRFLGSEATRQINRTAGGVGERLSSEFGQLQRTATDATGQDWRLFLIPILTEEGLEQLRFMLRKNEDDKKAAEDEAGIRFMIEVTMSRLGPFQFDGLTRDKHVDLVVRTQQELPAEIRDEIRSIFGNTITALGFTGTIVLRTVPKFEISPIEQFAASHKDLVV